MIHHSKEQQSFEEHVAWGHKNLNYFIDFYFLFLKRVIFKGFWLKHFAKYPFEYDF